MRGIFHHCLKLYRSLGFATASRLLLLGVEEKFFEFFKIPLRGGFVQVRVPGIPYPINFRRNSSDKWVFLHVFVHQDFEELSELVGVNFIVDCGANIGLSSIYFLTKYPQAKVLAVEPDENNFRLCEKNLKCYGERAHVLQCGVWPRKVGLKVETPPTGLKSEWAVQVRECLPDEKSDVPGETILNLLEYVNETHIDILKIDIEGTEKFLFSENFKEWLDRTKNIFIETHGDAAQRVFEAAISSYHCTLLRNQNLFVCKDIQATSEISDS